MPVNIVSIGRFHYTLRISKRYFTTAPVRNTASRCLWIYNLRLAFHKDHISEFLVWAFFVAKLYRSIDVQSLQCFICKGHFINTVRLLMLFKWSWILHEQSSICLPVSLLIWGTTKRNAVLLYHQVKAGNRTLTPVLSLGSVLPNPL